MLDEASSGIPESDLAGARFAFDEPFFARIVTLAADAIICVNGHHRITVFNRGAEATFGHSASEMLGRPLDLLIPSRLRHRHEAGIRAFSQGNAEERRMGERGRVWGLRKDGSEFPAEATISRIDQDGELILMVILRDMTVQTKIRDELERLVADRTAALERETEERERAQAQLLKAQRLEALGQLTGGIAHDFTNLLTMIGGNLELLKDRLPPGDHSKPLKRALDAVAMGGRLTERLLSVARRSALDPRLLDINAEIEATVETLRRSLGESIAVSLVLQPDLWRVRADASQVENALINLAINARDAMPKGGRLTIETTNAEAVSLGGTDAPGDYVRIRVADTGRGMEPAVLARAFEPFFTTKEPGKGTGLGLASIYGFAGQSGGHAAISSERGVGTEVSLFLPRADPMGEG